MDSCVCSNYFYNLRALICDDNLQKRINLKEIVSINCLLLTQLMKDLF